MVGIIQRLIQLLFIGFFIFAAIKPELIPPPAQSYAYQYSRFIIGDPISYSSFKNTWSQRWAFVTHWLPQLKGMKPPWPEPPETITADWVLTILRSAFLVEPLNKWQEVKHNILGSPLIPIATHSASPTPNQ